MDKSHKSCEKAEKLQKTELKFGRELGKSWESAGKGWDGVG